jgi:hypothetical protein
MPDIEIELIEAIPIAVEIAGVNVILPAEYFYLTSPDGSIWKITATNEGNLEREKIS